MWNILLAALAILLSACATTDSWDALGTQDSERGARAAGEYREHCESHESLDFGTKHAARLRGRVLIGDEGETEPAQALQVAARNVATGERRFVITASDGSFEISDLALGEYNVWTCLDGYDEITFHLVLDAQSPSSSFKILVGPSEAPGRRDVVLE